MDYLNTFKTLNNLLLDTKQYWQLLAFDQDQIPWSELEPELNSLNEHSLLELESDPDLSLAFFKNTIPQLTKIHQITSSLTQYTDEVKFPFWLETGVKGRKISQLRSFVAAVNEQNLPVLEWCAGKGHLGRMLIHKGSPQVHSIELQKHLCEQGNMLAKKYDMNIQFTQANVLETPVDQYIKSKQHVVALHACGQLHQTLMTKAVSTQTEKITLSPCCYHLIPEKHYQAMSDIAKHSTLDLTLHDLKLALQETVTAANRITIKRNIEVEWRLGFDQLMRSVTGDNKYISVPSVSKSMFSGSFKQFCLWAADKKSIKLPSDLIKDEDFEVYLAKGKVKKKVTERIELVRHLFRRAIEIWLILDRVLYLQQHGYQVEVNEFCEKQVTPRNILIRAVFAN